MKQLITVKQFSEKIGVSRQRVNILIQQKRINPAPVMLAGTYFLQINAKVIPAKRGPKFKLKQT